MRIHWAWIAVPALVLGAAPASIAYADGHEEAAENEHEITLESVPAPAREALLKDAAGAPIVKVEQATEAGKAVYSVHVKTPQGIVEIAVDASGKVLRRGPENDVD